jgi:hypothetical protein
VAVRIVINRCYGGFSLSPEAALWLFERGFDQEGFKTPAGDYFNSWLASGNEHDIALKNWREYLLSDRKHTSFVTVFSPDEKFVLSIRPKDRTHPLLVECVETMGDAASSDLADLEVIEIPDGIHWAIDEYDGIESVHEVHRSWP